MIGVVVEEELIIKADIKCVNGLENLYMDAKVLRLVKKVRNASKVVKWETIKLVAYLIKSTQKHALSRILPYIQNKLMCLIKCP